MTNNQLNRLSMYNAVRDLLTGATETAGIPTFVARFQMFTTLLARIEVLEAQQSEPFVSQIIDRGAALESMIEAVLAVAGAALSHVSAHGDDGLAVKLRPGVNEFRILRIAQRPTLAQHMLDAVKTLLAQPGDHGLTAAQVDDVQAKIDVAAAAVAASRNVIGAKRVATETLRTAFSEINTVLVDQLDRLMLSLKATNRDFYDRYRAARDVMNRPGARIASHAIPASKTLPDSAANPGPSAQPLAA